MMQKKRKVWLLRSMFWSGLLMATMFWLTACGGGGSDNYDDLDAEYMASDATAVATVEPAAVKTWVDNGLIIPETGQRVIILDCVPNPPGVFPYSDTESWFAGDAEKIKVNMAAQYGADSPQYLMINTLATGNLLGHIAGALPNVSHEGYEVTNRNDGPILAEHEVGTGSLIDQMLRQYGITKDDVLVLTTSRYDYPGFCPARLWWTLRYWGFSRDHIKVLNGGNKAYAMYAKSQGVAEPLQKGVTLPVVTPSTFSVTELPKKFFEERISLGELNDLIDSGRTALANDDPDKVVVIDTRQPPVAYFFKDANINGTPDIFEDTLGTGSYVWDADNKIFDNGTDKLNLSQVLFTATDGLHISFDATSNPPMTSPYFGIHMMNPANPAEGPLAIPLGAKPAAFEALMKGAMLTKTPAYNMTIPKLSRADGGYITPEEMRAVFALAGIDGSKPIVTYCNSGALAAIYYYALKEVAGFDDVRLYDGSWGEWANLTAFEPVTTDYVTTDNFTVYPAYPAGSPKIQVFAGQNHYFSYDAAADQFYDVQTDAIIDTDMIKAGGQLAGIPLWDTVSRSEYVMFRPTATVNGANKTYKSGVSWPSVETFPNYSGDGNLIREEDQQYEGAAPSGGGDAPTAFTPTGGGC